MRIIILAGNVEHLIGVSHLIIERAMEKLLTIGIATYNRIREIEKLVKQLVEHEVLNFAEILIIDDGGEGNVHDHFQTMTDIDGLGIRILKNEKNIGYLLTFVRLFEECRTDYMLVMADDDFVLVDRLRPLTKFLDIGPAFVSPQFLSGQIVDRGINETRNIMPYEFRACCNHPPGLVYRVAACKPGLAILLD